MVVISIKSGLKAPRYAEKSKNKGANDPRLQKI